jgi:hypothetical protein
MSEITIRQPQLSRGCAACPAKGGAYNEAEAG